MPSNLYCELWTVQELKDNGLDYASSKTQILNMRQKSLNQKHKINEINLENPIKMLQHCCGMKVVCGSETTET